jgi:hypothetical protein
MKLLFSARRIKYNPGYSQDSISGQIVSLVWNFTLWEKTVLSGQDSPLFQ